MEINVNVNGRILLDVKLPKSVLDVLGCVSSSEAAEAPAQAPTEVTPTEIQTEAPAKAPESAPAEVPAETSGDAPAPIQEPPPAEAIKAAMAGARARIEGEDWMTNTESEGYVKYHRKLNALFKATAQRIAGCKPTEITDPFQVRCFEDACRYMKVDDEGNVYEDRSVAALFENETSTTENNDPPF